jgi:sarcosine oxidase
MGAAAAWKLSREYSRVALLEQFDPHHHRGSSHGNSRIFRLAYENADYVRFGLQARSAWVQAAHEFGDELLKATGAIDIGPPAKIDELETAMSQAGVYSERHVNHSNNLFPQFAFPLEWDLLFQLEGGVIWAGRSLDAFYTMAIANGAEVSAGTQVTSVAPDGEGVAVVTDAGTYNADVAVIAAGGWAPGLLSSMDVSIPIVVTMEQVAFYPLRGNAQIPPFIWHTDKSAASFDPYGLPDSEGIVKVGHHQAGPAVEPGIQGEPEANRTETISRFVKEHMPCLKPVPVNSETCLYATTADDDFIIDRIGQVILAIGFGGHGFKFAPAVGDLVADLVGSRSLPSHATGFALARFQQSLTPS